MGDSFLTQDKQPGKDNLKPVPISFLFGKTFRIPYQQRGYKWTRKNVRILIKDLWEFLESAQEKKMYCLQPITVIPSTKQEKEGLEYEVIDGQQRLTTLYLLCKYLNIPSYDFVFDRDEKNERKNFLANEIVDNDTCSDFYFISEAYKAISETFAGKYYADEGEKQIFVPSDSIKEKFINLLIANESADKTVRIIWSVDEDAINNDELKHDSFRNINSGKIELSNADLIKAILLNSENSLESRERERIAVQLDQMEKQLAQDKFWFTFNTEDPQDIKGQSRMDLLYNIAFNISEETYKSEPRSSFIEYSELQTRNELYGKWEEIRDIYSRLLSLYNDPYVSQYVGLLTYIGSSSFKASNLIKELKTRGIQDFVKYLKIDCIKRYFNPNGNVILREAYSYDSPKHLLRELFVLHNVETLLHRYKVLDNINNGLQFHYERFPFELLYSQKWNIEHIASHTDNQLNTKVDGLDWAESTKADFPDYYKGKKTDFDEIIKELSSLNEGEKPSTSLKKKIDLLYAWCLEQDKNNGGVPDEKKNLLGNLVLLDEHTNKSFHNSFFPRKRSIVIVASGGKSEDERIMQRTERVYVPVCTLQVYLKGYKTGSDLQLSTWNEKDFDAYLKDIEEKLSDYFPNR